MRPLKFQVQHLLEDFHPILLLVSQLFPTHCQLYHTVSCNQSNGLNGLYPAWPHCPDHSWSLNQSNSHSIVHRDVIYCGTVTYTRDFAEWCICALGNPMLPTWKCHLGFLDRHNADIKLLIKQRTCKTYTSVFCCPMSIRRLILDCGKHTLSYIRYHFFVCAHKCIYVSFASIWIHVPLQVC